jgi:glutamate carboxypeptidase
MLQVLSDLVRIDSPSDDPGAIARFVGAYRTLLEGAGVRCREIPGPRGPHLLGELGAGAGAGPGPVGEEGDEGEAPPVVLVGHSDTVWPLGEAARRPPELREGRLYGPGVYDMRAGLCLIVFALRYLTESAPELSRPVRVFLAADEELGSGSAHEPMARLFPAEAVALVLEPPLADGSLKAERSGVGLYRLEATGREAHAGIEPERGVNAIIELAARLLEIASWAEPRLGLRVNVGKVEGGTATNVVPGRAAAGLDVRFRTLEDGEAFDRRLRALRPSAPGAALSLSGGIIFPPLVPDARARALHRLAIDTALGVGLTIGAGSSGGGSDGAFLASRGLAVLDGLGVEGGGAHSREEHIVVERLAPRAALLARLIVELAGARSPDQSPRSPSR